jgi:hypothetical protein
MLLVAKATRDNERVAKHLSRNTTQHVYGETANEFFTNLIRDMADDAQMLGSEGARCKAYTKAKDKGRAQTAVMCIEPFGPMYLALWKVDRYYSTTKLFQPNWVQKNLIGTHAAVSLAPLHSE